MNAALPDNETRRIEALRRYQILDTPPEAAFDRITRLAAHVFQVPIVFVSLIDQNRQWFKSCFGMDIQQTERDVAFCAHAILDNNVMVVPDATQDVRFATNPSVTGEPFIRFYAGAPLHTAQGLNLGTLCLIDTVPRTFSVEHQQVLMEMAAVVVDEMELRRIAQQLHEESTQRQEVEEAYARIAFFPEIDPNPIIETDLSGAVTYLNPAAAQTFATLASKGLHHPLFAEWHSWQQDLHSGSKVLIRDVDVDGICWHLIITHVPKSERIRIHCSDVSDSRRAETLLRTSEESLRLALQAGHMGTWDWNIEKGTGTQSDSYKRLFGVDPATFRGTNETLLQQLDKADRELLHQAFSQSLKDGSLLDVELRVTWPDGSLHWLAIVGQATLDATGRARRISGLAMDITERKKAEEALHKQAAKLREQAELLDLAHDTIIVRDLEGTITFWNHGAEALYGWSKAEALGQNSHQLLRTQFAHPLDEIEAILFRDGYVEDELTHYNRDGKPVIVATRWSLKRDQQEHPTAVLEINNDITARKSAEVKQNQLVAQVEQERRRLHDILSHVPGVFFEALGQPGSGQMKMVFVSDYVESMLGYSVEEWLTTPDIMASVIHPDDRDRIKEESAEILRGQGKGVSQYRVTAKNGRVVWVETHFNYIRGENGAPIGVRGVSMDITDRKQAELGMHYAMQKAESAREEAERANHAKSEFLSRMSHELRTPLNAILGFAQVLEMDDLAAQQRSSVEHILSGGEHLLSLINEVLDIARIETGHMTLSTEPVCLGDVVQEAIGMVQPLAAARRVQLHSEECPDGFVLADRQRLKQVLLNLLSNAIKYNVESGTVHLKCGETKSASGEDMVSMEVRDTGHGIAPDKMEKLFTPFERLGAEMSTVEGTGIGLALSKRLVELMNGMITVESVPGQGSTFRVLLPRAVNPIEAAGEVAAATSSSAKSSTDAATHTLLYIEDNMPNLQLIEQILLRCPGVRLISAMQGSMGLDLARQHHPDIILLDLHLPDMHGADVLQHLQEDALTRQIPVVIISADATPRQMERLLEAGAVDYLTKPLDVRRFLSLLNTILKK